MSSNPPWLDGLRRPRVSNRFRESGQDSAQLRLPRLAHWLESRRSPKLQLQQMRDDVNEAKSEIRQVLDRLAARHAIQAKDIDYAMSYADDMLSDAVYAVETALEREIEDQDPV